MFLFQLCAKKCPDQNALGFKVNISDMVCDYDLDLSKSNPTDEVNSVF